MVLLRELSAIVLWVVFLMLTASCIFSTFSMRNAVVAGCCFAAAFFIWPSKRTNSRSDDYWFFDLAELLIEGPVYLIGLLAKLFD